MRIYRPDGTDVWHFDFRHKGRRFRRSTGTTNHEAAKEYVHRFRADLWRASRIGERPSVTWNAAVLDWLASHKDLASIEDRKAQLRWASKYLRGKPLATIDRDVLDWLGKKKEKTGVANGTVNRMLAAVSAVLGHAYKKGWLPAKPAIPKRSEPRKRIRWATEEQADELVRALPPHLAAMAEFSLATGLRRHNVTHLEWSQVDLGRRLAWVHADQAKGKRDLAVPLSDSAVRVLRAQLGKDATWVFPWRGKPIRQTAQKAWDRACDAAGLEDFKWHDLRHTWASWHVQRGTPLAVLQELGGWRDMAMVMRYAHLAPGHLAAYAGNSGMRAEKRTVENDPEIEGAQRAEKMGWLMGLEPTTTGITRPSPTVVPLRKRKRKAA